MIHPDPQSAPNPESLSSARKGGRARAFEGETVKVALFLPPDVAGTLKAFAARHRLSPSLVVADWIQEAEVREALERGRKDFVVRRMERHFEADDLRSS